MLASRPPHDWASQDPTGRTRRKDGRMLSWVSWDCSQWGSETDIDIPHINILSCCSWDCITRDKTQFYTNNLSAQVSSSGSRPASGGDSMRRCSSKVAPHTYSATHFRVLEWSCPALVAPLALKLGRHRPTGCALRGSAAQEVASILSLGIRVNIRVMSTELSMSDLNLLNPQALENSQPTEGGWRDDSWCCYSTKVQQHNLLHD